MKIAILVPNFSEYSGDARVAELQAEELVKEGNEIVIFALDANITPKRAKLFVMGMPKSLFWQRVYRLVLPLDLIKTLRWLPKLKDFDLIISHLYPMNWFAYITKKFYKVKYTYWNHGIINPNLYPHLYGKLYIKLSNFLTKITTRNVDHVVSISKYAREEFKNYTGLESDVIYNKIDTKRFHEGIDGLKIREKYNLCGDYIILYVGRISYHKGIHLLIDAFDLIKRKIPNAKLIICGKHTFDEYSKKLKEMSTSSVIFAGYVPDGDLPFYYAACDIYATCTLWECYNLPLAEAQVCGKPVVAFDIGPHKEIINENGVLVKTGDINKFAQACVNMIVMQQRGNHNEK